jgi:hypothetical protein
LWASLLGHRRAPFRWRVSALQRAHGWGGRLRCSRAARYGAFRWRYKQKGAALVRREAFCSAARRGGLQRDQWAFGGQPIAAPALDTKPIHREGFRVQYSSWGENQGPLGGTRRRQPLAGLEVTAHLWYLSQVEPRPAVSHFALFYYIRPHFFKNATFHTVLQ